MFANIEWKRYQHQLAAECNSRDLSKLKTQNVDTAMETTKTPQS